MLIHFHFQDRRVAEEVSCLPVTHDDVAVERPQHQASAQRHTVLPRNQSRYDPRQGSAERNPTGPAALSWTLGLSLVKPPI
jgi:ferric-dicitrate binding protein FerR (iron transport regulator)